jgi:hypothetical protein
VAIHAARVAKDRREHLTVLVDRTGRHALGVQLAQKHRHLPRGDPRCGPVAERGHEDAGALALAATVWRAGLGEHVAVFAQGGRLGAALVLQVLQPLRRQLSECDATLAALALARLDRALLPVVLGGQLSHAHGRALFVEVALRHSPTPHDPPAVVRRPLKPSRPHAALHLSARASPLGDEYRFEYHTASFNAV